MEHMNQSRERSIGRGLRGAAMVKIQHAAEALTADNRTRRHAEVIGWIDDLIFQPLMVSFPVIMREIFSDRVSQLCLVEKDHSRQTLVFDTAHEPFDVRVKIGGSRGQEQRFGARSFERGPKRFGKFCVAVHQDVLFIDQKSVASIRQVACDLFHPSPVRRNGATRECYAPRFEMDREQQIKRDQPVTRPNLDRRKINRGQDVPMRFEKCTPSRLTAAFWCQFNSVFAEDIADRLVGNRMGEIGQRPSDAVVAPRRILTGDAKDQCLDIVTNRRSTDSRAFVGMIPFLGDEFAMPTEDGIGRKDRADLGEQFPAKDFGFDGQSTALIVVQKNPFLPLLFLEYVNRR